MTEVDFYLLDVQDPHQRKHFACRLADKAFKQGHQVYIHTENEADAREIYDRTAREESNLPHTDGVLLRLTRDSVAAGDDCDAPHLEKVRLPVGTTVEEVVTSILASRYLPRIDGGKATWSLVSKRPIAVLAQQWQSPKMLSPNPYCLESLGYANDVLRIHATYHVQQDPDVVFEVLDRLTDQGF